MTPLRLDFTLQQGAFTLVLREQAEVRVLALFGPSGCGKTTAIEAIAGLRTPRSGEIRVGDHVLYSSAAGINLPPRQRRIGLVPQDGLLFPHMNVHDNVLYGAARGGTLELARVVDLLEIGPVAGRRVASLSGGERQRVAIARALMSNPAVLLLDEPLAAVDEPRRRRIVPALQRVRDELGLPMVYVTHDRDEVAALADRVIVLDEGRVVGAGPPGDTL